MATNRRKQRLYSRRRRALLAALGGECICCHAEEALHVHHIYERNYDVRALCSSTRQIFYLRDVERRTVALLCERCHGRATAAERRGCE